jgi:hypothetical protein
VLFYNKYDNINTGALLTGLAEQHHKIGAARRRY